MNTNINANTKHTSREYIEEVYELQKAIANAKNTNERKELLVNWGSLEDHEIIYRGGQVLNFKAYGFDRIDSFSPMDDLGKFKKFVNSVMDEISIRKEAIRKMKENAAKKVEKVEKKDDPAKKVINALKNRVSELSTKATIMKSQMDDKDEIINILKRQIANLTLENEQIRNENADLMIYKELVEEAA